MRLALACLLALSLVSRFPAQEPAPPAPVNPPPPPVIPPEPAKVPVRERERTIYVPYEELEKIFSDGGKGVFLPYKEFLALWNELTLKRRDDEESKPPQDGVVSRADYTARVEGETLVMDAVVAVESFKKGWLTVPLAKGGVIPGIAEVDAGKAVLRAKPDGYDILLPEKGRYELKLKIYAPLRKSGGKHSVSLALPQAAVSRFTATIPGSGWEFQVKPAAAFTSRGAGADTELSFFFGSGGSFEVTWNRPEAATELKPLILASSAITAEVRGGSLATRAGIDLRILRAPVASFAFLVPAGQEIMGVTGDDVKDWKLETAGDRQRLVVTPNAPVREKWGVVLALEAPLPKLPADATVPEIVVEGAAQDRGEIGISAEPHLDVTPRPADGMMQQTQGGAPAPGLAAVGGFRFLKHPAGLTLGIAEARPQVDVDSLTVLTVKRDSSRVEATFNYNIRRVGIFEARLALPPGWTGWEVAGLPPDAWSVEKAGATETLAVRFGKQTIGAASIAIFAVKQRANPTEDAVVPVFAPQGVVRHDAKIGVGVHSSLEVNTRSPGDLRPDDVNAIGTVLQLSAGNTYSGATFINGGVLRAQRPVQTVAPPADTELRLAFRHRDAVRTPAMLAFKARDPQINVDVLTLVEAREQSLRHTWKLAFDVNYAGVDRFVLAVPKSVADDIRFVDPGVKEIHKDYQADAALLKNLPDAANYAVWEIVLRNERTGSFEMSLSVEKPLPAGKEARLDLLQAHVLGASQETGQVAVVKDDNLEIRKYDAEGFEEIDPKELHPSLRRDGVFVALKWRSLPVKLALDMARNAYKEVPTAVITHAVLTTAVSTDLQQTTEVVYWVKNNAQQFLTVRLPKSARLLSDAFVNGATQQPMKREGSEDLLVRLPSGAAALKQAVPVRLVFEMPSPKAGEKMGWWGRFQVLPPEALDNLGKPLLVLEAHHRLYLPEHRHYTKFDGPMTQTLAARGWNEAEDMARALIPAFGPQPDRDTAEWQDPPQIPADQIASLGASVHPSGQRVDLHRLGAPGAIDVRHRSDKVSFFYEAVAFFLVMLAGLARLRRPLPRKVVFIAIVGFGALLSTGMVSAANAHISRAVLLGLVFVILLWCVVGVIGMLRHAGAAITGRSRPEPPPSRGGGGTPPTPPPPPPAPAPAPAPTPRPLSVSEAVPAAPVPVPAPGAFPPSAAFSVWTEARPDAPAAVPGLEFPTLGGSDEGKSKPKPKSK